MLLRRGNKRICRIHRAGLQQTQRLNFAWWHLVHQAVATQHEAVSGNDGDDRRVDRNGKINAQRAGNDIATRVGAGFVCSKQALRHQLLNVGVVNT